MLKTVLITGCSTGIGKALAKEFNSRDWQVFATARNLESIEDLIELEIKTIALDINSSASLEKAHNIISAETDNLQILINNAGYAAMGPLVELPAKDLELQFKTNVLSQIEVIKTFLPLLIKTPSTVANISSVSGDFTTPFAGAYCATKAAFSSLSDALRMELAPFNISVVDVRPGSIESNFGSTAKQKVDGWLKPDSIYSRIADAIIARATASQQNPTPAVKFAKQLATKLEQKNPKSVIRIGRGSIALLILGRWVPRRIREKILMKKFHLDRL